MGVRKVMTKILNLAYLAGAGFAIYSLVTQPLLQLNLSVAITGDTLASLLPTESEENNEETKSEVYRVALRDGEPQQPEENDDSTDIMSMLTADKISKAIGDDTKISINIEIPATAIFDLENKTVLNDLVKNNIENVINDTVNTLVPKLTKLVKSLAAEFASEQLSGSIADMVADNFGVEGAEVSSEEVAEILDNVLETLSSEEGTTVDQLTDALLGTKKYTEVPADKKTAEDFSKYYVLVDGEYVKADDGARTYDANTKYFVPAYDEVPAGNKKPENFDKYYVLVDGEYVKADDGSRAYDENETYYQEAFSAGIYSILQQNGADFDVGDVDTTEVEEALTEALSQVPGLTSPAYNKVEDANKKAEDFDKYYVKNNDGTYTKASENGGTYDSTKEYYVPAYKQVTNSNADDFDKYYVLVDGDYVKANDGTRTYDDSETYYVEDIIINNIDEALANLLAMFAGGDNTEESDENQQEPEKSIIKRDGEPTVQEQSTDKKSIEDTVKDLILSMIPLETITDMDLSIGGYAPLILAGVVALAALPWALFALGTLIRTIRPKKCWAKPGFIFFWCFLELVLGIGLTLGIKYGLDYVINVNPDILGSMNLQEPILSIIKGLSFNLQFSVFYPSFVYVAMIPFTIIYAFFAHGPKVEYKIWKKSKKFAKRISKDQMTFQEVEEKYQADTRKILSKKYDIEVE